MKTKTRTLTLLRLERLNACSEQKRRFRVKFGQELIVTPKTAEELYCNKGHTFDVWWIAAALLSEYGHRTFTYGVMDARVALQHSLGEWHWENPEYHHAVTKMRSELLVDLFLNDSLWFRIKEQFKDWWYFLFQVASDF